MGNKICGATESVFSQFSRFNSTMATFSVSVDRLPLAFNHFPQQPLVMCLTLGSASNALSTHTIYLLLSLSLSHHFHI